MKSIRSFLFAISLGASILSACAQNPQGFGIIEGHVAIGPLVPVVREGQSEPTPNPALYKDREVIIFKEDGKTEFTRLKIDANGNYRGELPVGTYVVDINHIGIDTAKNLPKEIEITNQEVTRLDIDIDTGIR
jgi:hypothetical protein